MGYTLAGQLASRQSTNGLLGGWTVPPRSDTYATANGRNQYTTVSGRTYNHDDNGNLTTNGLRSYGYDVENRLTSVTGSPATTLTYDPLGRLRQTVAGSVTTQFLYDGDRLIAEYNGSGSLLRRYVHGPGVDEPLVWYEGAGLTDRRWLHTDERGSVVAQTNGSGTATPYSYGAYGEPSSWTGSRFRYTGQIMLPEAQLYHYKARVYDPIDGRLLQTDPVGYGDQLNLYAYVYNDPINVLDPTGECRSVERQYQDCTINVDDERHLTQSQQDDVANARQAILDVGKAVAQAGNEKLTEAWEQILNFRVRPNDESSPDPPKQAAASADLYGGEVTIWKSGLGRNNNAYETRHSVVHEVYHYARPHKETSLELDRWYIPRSDPRRHDLEKAVEKDAYFGSRRLRLDGERLVPVTYDLRRRYE